MKDQHGNAMSVEITQEGNKITQKVIYTLENGKTTLRGEYKKFKADNECAFPERLSCNSEIGCSRCPHMQFISIGNWRCTFFPAKEAGKP